MSKNIVYIPISEETLSFIEKLKTVDLDTDTFLNNILAKQLFDKDINLIQQDKMKELWDNKADEVWNKL